MPGKTQRVGIYARVSTDGQETENQLVQLRDFCARQGWQVFREYIYRESGSKGDREQLSVVFQDASQRRFDLLLFWSLDRLSREGVLKTLVYLNRLEACGVGFRSFTEAYLDSCGMFRDAVLAVLATLAKQERIRISERTRAGLRVARAKGKRIGRPQAAVDCATIARLRSQGHSYRAIGRQLGISDGTVKQRLASAQKGFPNSPR